MIDLSKLKAPGWQRVVTELSAPVPDDRAFLTKLVSILAQVSGARQAVLFSIGSTAGENEGGIAEPRPLVVWPPNAQQPGAGAAEQPPIEREADQKTVARAAAQKHRTEVYGLEKDDLLYDGTTSGYVVGVPVPPGAPRDVTSGSRTVVTLLIDARSQQALQTTLAIIEILAGYSYGHTSQMALRKTRQASAALDLAAQLLGAINNTTNFKGTTIQFVNDLQRALHVDRVALGWTKGIGEKGEGETVKCIAISDTEQVDRRMDMVRKLEAAMDECLDQEQPVVYPQPEADGDKGDVLLNQAIVHAHRELAAADAKLKVASMPLRVGDKVVGVVTFETTADTPIDISMIELIQATLDLVAPVLRVRRSDDRALPLKTLDMCVKGAGWVVGPKHTVWKLAGIAALALVISSFVVHIPYRVQAPLELQPRTKRAVAAPYDGVLALVPANIEPGTNVEQGDLLAQLETTELELSLLEAESQIIEAIKQRDGAREQGKHAEADQFEAQRLQAKARADLLLERIAKASIVAPISGQIVAGDLEPVTGSAVKLGQGLFEIAQMDEMIVIARVSDRDIKLLTDRLGEEGQIEGDIAAKAYPGLRYKMTVERIVPLASPDEGDNTFEVRARLDDSAPWMRPGMEGIAKFSTEEHSIAWILSRRIVDQVRLWLWW